MLHLYLDIKLASRFCGTSHSKSKEQAASRLLELAGVSLVFWLSSPITLRISSIVLTTTFFSGSAISEDHMREIFFNLQAQYSD